MDKETLFFSFIPIGAFNVGSINLNFDNKIITNNKLNDKQKWYKLNNNNNNKREPPYGKEFKQSPVVKDFFENYDKNVSFEKGEEIGYFSFG